VIFLVIQKLGVIPLRLVKVLKNLIEHLLHHVRKVVELHVFGRVLIALNLTKINFPGDVEHVFEIVDDLLH
jgi:hypothetical protein